MTYTAEQLKQFEGKVCRVECNTTVGSLKITGPLAVMPEIPLIAYRMCIVDTRASGGQRFKFWSDDITHIEAVEDDPCAHIGDGYRETDGRV
jgi:hypothetical protein